MTRGATGGAVGGAAGDAKASAGDMVINNRAAVSTVGSAVAIAGEAQSFLATTANTARIASSTHGSLRARPRHSFSAHVCEEYACKVFGR